MVAAPAAAASKLRATGAVVVGAAAGAAAGFVGSGGNIKAAFVGAITGAAFAGIGNHTQLGRYQKAFAHGSVGGAGARMQGGSFKDGFLGAFFAAAINPSVAANDPAALAKRTIIGGVASRLGGGKFANGAVSAAMAYILNESIHPKKDAQKGQFQNSRSDCPGQCTLVTNPNGTKMYVPRGVAGQVVAANAKGITLAQEQATPSGVDALKAFGTAADAAILINPATAPVAGPIGLAADLAVSVAEKDLTALIPTAAGSGVKAGLRVRNVTESVSERVSAGTELILDQTLE